LAKSVKSPKSKLQQKLQVLFLVDFTLAQAKLPKIISVEPREVFYSIRENLSASTKAFYALELVLKFTPDEHKNEKLFSLLKDFLGILNKESNQEILEQSLAKFKIEILEAVGFGIHKPADFITNIEPEIYKIFSEIKEAKFNNLANINKRKLEQLQELLSDFIEYQLERQVKSEKYLKM
jgi:recombinational DNA repair protein (RecF pathway)